MTSSLTADAKKRFQLALPIQGNDKKLHDVVKSAQGMCVAP
jgi:hypothetical protein